MAESKISATWVQITLAGAVRGEAGGFPPALTGLPWRSRSLSNNGSFSG
jgi:hypothetical protein